MVNATLVFGVLFSFFFLLSMIFIALFFIVGDIKRGFKFWYMKKFKINRRSFLVANLINASGNEYSLPVKVEDGKFIVGDKKTVKNTYTVNFKRCVLRCDGYLSGHWKEGSSEQIDYNEVYKHSPGDSVIIDQIILRAKAANKFDELWNFLRGEKARMYLQYAQLIGLGIVILFLFMILADVKSIVQTGVSSGVVTV